MTSLQALRSTLTVYPPVRNRLQVRFALMIFSLTLVLIGATESPSFATESLTAHEISSCKTLFKGGGTELHADQSENTAKKDSKKASSPSKRSHENVDMFSVSQEAAKLKKSLSDEERETIFLLFNDQASIATPKTHQFLSGIYWFGAGKDKPTDSMLSLRYAYQIANAQKKLEISQIVAEKILDVLDILPELGSSKIAISKRTGTKYYQNVNSFSVDFPVPYAKAIHWLNESQSPARRRFAELVILQNVKDFISSDSVPGREELIAHQAAARNILGLTETNGMKPLIQVDKYDVREFRRVEEYPYRDWASQRLAFLEKHLPFLEVDAINTTLFSAGFLSPVAINILRSFSASTLEMNGAHLRDSAFEVLHQVRDFARLGRLEELRTLEMTERNFAFNVYEALLSGAKARISTGETTLKSGTDISLPFDKSLLISSHTAILREYIRLRIASQAELIAREMTEIRSAMVVRTRGSAIAIASRAMTSKLQIYLEPIARPVRDLIQRSRDILADQREMTRQSEQEKLATVKRGNQVLAARRLLPHSAERSPSHGWTHEQLRHLNKSDELTEEIRHKLAAAQKLRIIELREKTFALGTNLRINSDRVNYIMNEFFESGLIGGDLHERALELAFPKLFSTRDSFPVKRTMKLEAFKNVFGELAKGKASKAPLELADSMVAAILSSLYSQGTKNEQQTRAAAVLASDDALQILGLWYRETLIDAMAASLIPHAMAVFNGLSHRTVKSNVGWRLQYIGLSDYTAKNLGYRSATKRLMKVADIVAEHAASGGAADVFILQRALEEYGWTGSMPLAATHVAPIDVRLTHVVAETLALTPPSDAALTNHSVVPSVIPPFHFAEPFETFMGPLRKMIVYHEVRTDFAMMLTPFGLETAHDSSISVVAMAKATLESQLDRMQQIQNLIVKFGDIAPPDSKSASLESKQQFIEKVSEMTKRFRTHLRLLEEDMQDAFAELDKETALLADIENNAFASNSPIAPATKVFVSKTKKESAQLRARMKASIQSTNRVFAAAQQKLH